MDDTSEPRLGLGDSAPRTSGAEHYRVLARKYRPQNFTGLIGQEALVRTLRNAFASGRIAHAFVAARLREHPFDRPAAVEQSGYRAAEREYETVRRHDHSRELPARSSSSGVLIK